ncbi:MAG: ABC transporter ATP-binding protein [Candidatus Marinimicrobia bacterium]|nr:ABC transporter ATP-binding protein [Candidatus Neomarinimicrobiota bacterium]
MDDKDVILRIKELSISYQSSGLSIFGNKREIIAVNEVSLSVERGKTFAIVGESGSGKTSIAMSILGFVKPVSGSIEFNGLNLSSLKTGKQRETRRLIQPVFQDANSALNPRMTVETSLLDSITSSDKIQRMKQVNSLLSSVGLSSDHMGKYPHELSGGQKQRLCIARALAPEPELLILDEPVSAQDLSIQAQILSLLLEIKKAKNITYLLISHDLNVVRILADRVAVMRSGIIVEEASCEKFFSDPTHPYSQELIENSGIK